jgi:serine/threonine protein kinase
MIGQTVGKYRVEERIGRGGMGTVYRAVDETLRREVAIKVLNSDLNDPEVAKRFRAEAITVARLNHTGIATVYELFEHEGQWLMVMEFVRGETLERLIERAGPLSAERAAELCMQALAALTHAHDLGVVHRDLKPANLMLTDGGAVKIMDFGIARVSGSEHLTNAGFMMGTPAYMAPEQVLGHEVDARTDIYAMGVVLYRLTTSKLPFKGETPFALAQSQVNDPPTPVRTAREGLPGWLEEVLARALAKAPVERFQTALEFRDALQRSLAGLPLRSLFDQTAPTGMLRTPAVLPSGAFATSPSVSGAIPTSGGTASQPSMTASTNLPGTSPSTAQTMMASSTGAAPVPVPPPGSTAAIPQASGTFAAATAVVPAPVASVTRPAAKKNPNMMYIGAAAGVILAVIAYFVVRQMSTPPEAPDQTVPTGVPNTQTPPPDPGTPPASGAAGATGASQPATSAPPAQTPPSPPATGTAGASPTTAAAGSSAAPGAATPPGATTPATTPATAPGTSATTPPGTPPASAAARGDAGRAGGRNMTAADVADSLIIFRDVRLLTFSGRKGSDQDVILHFAKGDISIILKKGGEAFKTIPYKTVAHATYIKAKDPKGDASLKFLPEDPDIPGGPFGRGSRNWLVLQSKTESVILSLHDDSKVAEVLRTFEARTGVKIDRPTDSSK